MRINAEKMNEFEGAENVRGRKETFRDQLWIEIAPIFSRYQRGGRILFYLGALLKIRC